MKVVILAGGFGTRISEESLVRPKPMIEIGNRPILWHIMKSYSFYGFNDFIICAGYKQSIIKEYFYNYYLNCSDLTLDFRNPRDYKIHRNVSEPWRITIVDTGLNTLTGGRIKRVKEYIGNDTFMMTYGDGLCDVNLTELANFHKAHGRLATLTAVEPGGRFGRIDIDPNGAINSFEEKKKEDGGWINGGFMILEPEVLNYIDGDNTTFEHEPLENLAKAGQLAAYKHSGFWQCMDTMKDKEQLERLINTNQAPWIKW